MFFLKDAQVEGMILTGDRYTTSTMIFIGTEEDTLAQTPPPFNQFDKDGEGAQWNVVNPHNHVT